MDVKFYVGSTIVVLLLVIYVGLVAIAADAARCPFQVVNGAVQVVPPATCNPGGLSENMAYTMALIGGLISALVVAQLTLTEMGSAPLAFTLDASRASARVIRLTEWMTLLYLTVWIAVGLYALVVTLPDPASPWSTAGIQPSAWDVLSTLGRSWLGLAVAAAYAYFGIQPPKAAAGDPPVTP
jgi:hypothetical protein